MVFSGNVVCSFNWPGICLIYHNTIHEVVQNMMFSKQLSWSLLFVSLILGLLKAMMFVGLLHYFILYSDVRFLFL